MEINIDDLQEKLDESNAIEPPKSMNELMERIYQAGELWREEHAETVGKRWFGCQNSHTTYSHRS